MPRGCAQNPRKKGGSSVGGRALRRPGKDPLFFQHQSGGACPLCLSSWERERASECEHSDQCEKRRSVSLSTKAPTWPAYVYKKAHAVQLLSYSNLIHVRLRHTDGRLESPSPHPLTVNIFIEATLTPSLLSVSTSSTHCGGRDWTVGPPPLGLQTPPSGASTSATAWILNLANGPLAVCIPIK